MATGFHRTWRLEEIRVQACCVREEDHRPRDLVRKIQQRQKAAALHPRRSEEPPSPREGFGQLSCERGTWNGRSHCCRPAEGLAVE